MGLLLRLHLHVAHGHLLIDIGAWLLLVESLLLIRVLRGMLVDLVMLQGVHRQLLHVMTLGSLFLSLLLRQQNGLGHSLEILLVDLLKVSLVGLLLMVRQLGSPGVLEI